MTALRMAVIGAGPAGLALALLACRRLPGVEVTVFDARPAERDVSRDPRTLALAWGSVLLLKQLQAWPASQAAAIETVHVSQAPPSWGDAAVRIQAREMGVPMLGAVMAYGPLVAGLQQAWQDEAARFKGAARRSRFGTAVTAVNPVDGGVEVAWENGSEHFDLAVIAEGGVFGSRAGHPLATHDARTGPAAPPRPPAVTRGASPWRPGMPLVHDYGQNAWIGTATLEGAPAGTAFERFTRQGPVALLPLARRPDEAGATSRYALVWCVDQRDDPVSALSDAQRLHVLGTLLPPEAGRLVALSALKCFALGLQAEHSLRRGRVVRIGNAAQTLHPVAGQGLNLGLRDAQALVQAVLHGIGTTVTGTGSSPIDRALAQVDWSRAADRWSTIAVTDFLARSFTWQAPGLAAARGAALATLGRITPIKQALARRMMFGQR